MSLKLLITRPQPDADILGREAAATGFTPLIHPLMVFQPAAYERESLAAADGIILTSRNSLRALENSRPIDKLLSVPVFAVGSATAAEARSNGFQNVRQGPGNAAALAAEIEAHWGRKRHIVHLTGEDQAFPLEAALKGKGMSVTACVCYRMAACNSFDPWLVRLMSDGEVHGVILMSPRTADIYARLCSDHGLERQARRITAYCLSDQIAGRLESLDPLASCWPPVPTQGGLLALYARQSQKLTTTD